MAPPHSSSQSWTLKLPDNSPTAEKFLKVKSITGSGATATGQLEFADEIGSLKIDSSNNRVGIGTTSPDGGLHVKGVSDHGKIIVEHGGTSGSTNHNFISFHNHAGNTVAEIQSEENATNQSALLFKTGGTTTNMTISKDGQITKPNQPAFHAGLNSAANSGSYVDDFVLHADTGNHFNASTGIFTAPVAGKYFFSAFFMTNNSANTIDFSLHVNNTDYHYLVPYQGGGSLANYNHAGGSCIVALSANDTVRIRNNNTQLYGSSGNGRHSGFCGFLIG